MSVIDDRVGLFAKALGQWQHPQRKIDPSHHWTLQRFDEARGVFQDVSTTDSAVKADQIFRQGPEWRVIDNAKRDIAAEYVPYRVGHATPPLTYREALWQADYAPRSNFAQAIETEAAQHSVEVTQVDQDSGLELEEETQGPRP